MPFETTLVGFSYIGEVQCSNGKTRRVINSIGYRYYPHTVQDADLDVLWDRCGRLVWASILPLLPDTYHWVEGQARYLTNPTPAWRSYPQDFYGGTTGPRTEVHIALYVWLRSAYRGRANYGFKRIGPLSKSHVDGDQLRTDALQQWTDAVQVFTQDAAVLGGAPDEVFLRPVIWQRVHPPEHIDVATGQCQDVVSAVVNPVLSECSRRKERHQR